METDKKSSCRNCVVHLLVILFGVSPFVAFIGVGVELPILVNILPEAWQLSSYLVIAFQAANLGPIIFSAARKIWSQKVLEIPIIHSSFALVTLACALLSIFWNYTTTVFGQMHSTALLVLYFFISCVSCTSMLLYLPFMENFKEQYVVSYVIGTSLSGPINSLLALSQGVGDHGNCRNVTVTMNSTSNVTEYVVEEYYTPPRFSVNVFFVCLCGQMVICWIAFVLLNTLQIAKRERVSLMPVTRSSNPASVENCERSIDIDFAKSIEKTTSSEENLLGKSLLSKSQSYLLLTIMGFLCLIHEGVLGSLQTYSYLPYGSSALQMTVTLPNILNPLLYFMAMFVSITNVYAVAGLFVFVAGCSAYILALALLSPNPPLVETQFGAILAVLACVLESGAASVVRVSITSIFRRHGGQGALYKMGVVAQIGSAIGAIVIFSVLQLTDLFQSKTPCT